MIFPFRLWRCLTLEATPKVAPLIVFVILVHVIHAVGICGATLILGLARTSSIGPLARAWSTLARAISPPALGKDLGRLVILLLTWAALLLFQQTIARYRIRPRQLFRVLMLAWCAMMRILSP